MKIHKFFILACAGCCTMTFGQSLLADNTLVTLNTAKEENSIAIAASFTLPLSQCEAYRYLTDNSSQNALSGIVYAKTKRITANKVQVDRRVKEYVLFIPVHLDSLIEITELPYTGTDFFQIYGSAKSYKGSWRLEPAETGTKFIFQGTTDPGTMMPGFLVEHYLKKNLRANFEEVARIGLSRKGIIVDECRMSS